MLQLSLTKLSTNTMTVFAQRRERSQPDEGSEERRVEQAEDECLEEVEECSAEKAEWLSSTGMQLIAVHTTAHTQTHTHTNTHTHTHTHKHTRDTHSGKQCNSAQIQDGGGHIRKIMEGNEQR
jgi:hypothetical protein